MRVLILEDNEKTRKALVKIVRSCAPDGEICDFGKRADAYMCAWEKKRYLFLIDIVLEPQRKNDNSGIVFADSMRGNVKYRLTPIIFITVLSGLEPQLLKRVHCYDYIEKPIGDGEIIKRRLSEVIEGINFGNKHKQREYIPLRHDGIGYMVYVDEVIYFASRRRTLYIYTVDDTIITPNLSAKNFLRKIKHTLFLMPTYGTAVNPKYIDSIDFRNREVYLRGTEDVVSIGGRMLKQFREAYMEWCG